MFPINGDINNVGNREAYNNIRETTELFQTYVKRNRNETIFFLCQSIVLFFVGNGKTKFEYKFGP